MIREVCKKILANFSICTKHRKKKTTQIIFNFTPIYQFGWIFQLVISKKYFLLKKNFQSHNAFDHQKIKTESKEKC